MRFEFRLGVAVITVLLHVLVLSALVRVTESSIRPPALRGTWRATADNLRDAGERIVSVNITTGLSLNGIACVGDSYVGVGILADPRTERIILVGENTPASRAGLQHDDIVLNPSVWRNAHNEGALLHVVILREGVKMAATVLVGKICLG